MRSKNKNLGFVALMTAIMLSVILMTVAISLNQVGFLTRSEVLDSEYKDRSFALAEGCVDIALLKLAQNSGYNPTDECYSVGDTCLNGGPNICTVVSVSPSALGQITINTGAVFPSTNGAITKLKVVIDSSDLSVSSLVEEP